MLSKVIFIAVNFDRNMLHYHEKLVKISTKIMTFAFMIVFKTRKAHMMSQNAFQYLRIYFFNFSKKS
jgi:hypothetical protein